MRTGVGLRTALLCSVLAACGGGGGDDDDFADASPQPDTGPTPDGGDGDGDGDAGGPVDGPVDVTGPIVTVIDPVDPAGSLDSDDIVTTDRLVARCEVEGNPNTGDGVDPASVRVNAFGVGGMMRQAFAQPTTVEDVYEATLVLTGFFNGELTVRCTASDLATPARTNSAETLTFLDLGPAITVFSPLDNASYANAVDVSFRISADPVAADDPGAAPNLVDGFTASVAGVDITDDLDPQGGGVFSGTIQFTDPSFVPSLDGDQTLVIRAANTRSPTPVERLRTVPFRADSQGPSITIDEPAPGELIAGIMQVSATISDPAGVDDLSVVATLAGTHSFPLTFAGGDTYEGSFDTRTLKTAPPCSVSNPDCLVHPNLVVRARDAVGNERAVGRVITLDNVSPIVDLDPPPMREMQYNPTRGINQCSWYFDPLGSHPYYGDDTSGEAGDASAADDGETVPQLSELRARIEDRGNGASASTGVLVPMAGVDEGSAQIYVLDDSQGALIVDTDGDGVCDDINPNIVPTTVPVASNEAAVVDLVALAPEGVSVFTVDDPDPFDHSPGSLEFLCFEGDDTDVGLPLCVQEPGNRITSTQEGDPVIYGLATPTEDQCWGNAFDSYAANIADGWACVAVRARDGVGNIGVSPPLRVCFDADGNQSDGCADWGEIQAPPDDCTGTWNASTGVTDEADDCILPIGGAAAKAPAVGFAEFPERQIRCLDECPVVNLREVSFCNFLEETCSAYLPEDATSCAAGTGADGVYCQIADDLDPQEICFDAATAFDNDEDGRVTAALASGVCEDAEAIALCHFYEDTCIYGVGAFSSRTSCINGYTACSLANQRIAKTAMANGDCAGIDSACGP
jgi:hypothetical protein